MPATTGKATIHNPQQAIPAQIAGFKNLIESDLSQTRAPNSVNHTFISLNKSWSIRIEQLQSVKGVAAARAQYHLVPQTNNS
jgi:hypothetical protein